MDEKEKSKELKAYVSEVLHHAFMVRCRTNKRTMAEVLQAAAQAYTNGDTNMMRVVEKYQR